MASVDQTAVTLRAQAHLHSCLVISTLVRGQCRGRDRVLVLIWRSRESVYYTSAVKGSRDKIKLREVRRSKG